jgi:cell division protein FtsN
VLRMLVLALLLANAAYFAWAQGLLAAYGFVPARQSEPERLAQQIRPEAMQLITNNSPARPSDTAPASATTAPSTTTQCLQVGVFTEQQAHALRARLQSSLPKDSWSFESSGDSVRWIIYMGKYISKEAMNRKRLKLQQLGLSFEPPVSPALNPGLSLGSFSSQAEAENTLTQMNQRGIRSAKVVLERPELPSLWLKLPAADAPMRTRLDALKPQLAGKAVQACQ